MSLPAIKDIARGRWPRILAQFGVDKAYLVNRHGPCPVCGGADRFRFDNKLGAGTYYCNQCGAGDGMKLLMMLTGKTYKELAVVVQKMLENDGDAYCPPAVTLARALPKSTVASQEQLDTLARMWTRTSPIVAGDSVALYLASRGIGVSRRLANLRMTVVDGLPVMLARVQHGSRRTLETPMCQLHRTYLPIDGERERKLMPMPHPAGSAVRLFEVDREVMGVAEGIETALSAATMFQLPVWAALNTARLATFVPPPGVKRVRIFADHDRQTVLANGKIVRPGLEAAITLANELADGGLDAQIDMPPDEGTDWNDVLREYMDQAIDAGAQQAS